MAEISHVTIEERLTQLIEAKKRLETNQTPHPKIQRVSHYLRDRKDFAKHYSPKLVSFGPIHHGEANLELGEQYKLMWTVMYIESTKQTAQTLLQKIANNIKELKDLFTKEAIRGFDDGELSWILFVDGCSLLQILDKANLYHPEKLNVKLDQLILVLQDVILLENQLPFKLLWQLSRSDNEAKLMDTMDKFLHCHHLSADGLKKVAKRMDPAQIQTKEESIVEVEKQVPVSPTHLLDLSHKIVLNLHDRHPNMEEATGQNCNIMTTYRNVRELKEEGIEVKTSNSRCLREISFSSGTYAGQLKLPEIIVDDTTATTFLNLIAYEMCPDFKNDYEICSFVAFLHSLIRYADDVALLRSAGILHNYLGSDEEVVSLFNTVGNWVPDTERYAKVRAQIEKHLMSERKTWMAERYYTYFGKNPWAPYAFLNAILLLLLTVIQTWYAVRSNR